jgi:hypothetical protein
LRGCSRPKRTSAFRREMHDATGAAHCLRQAARIEEVASEKGEIAMPACRHEKFRHARAKIVVTDNDLAIAEQAIDQIATDEPGRPCHKRSQDALTPHSEHKFCGPSIIVKHFDGLKGIIAEVLADKAELFQNIVCYGDDMAADPIGLKDIE